MDEKNEEVVADAVDVESIAISVLDEVLKAVLAALDKMPHTSGNHFVGGIKGCLQVVEGLLRAAKLAA